MNLFELAATLGLDISDFQAKATIAEESANGLKDALDVIKVGSIDDTELQALDADIAALDEEIAALESEIEDLELDLRIDGYDQEIADNERAIASAERRTSAFAGVIEGLANAAADFVGELMTDALDFVGEGFKKAGNAGTELAERYQSQMRNLSATTDLVQEKIGTGLLSLVVDELSLFGSLEDVISGIFGITEEDKLNAAIRSLSEYEFTNLEQAWNSLKGIFSFGETVDLEPVEMTFEQAMESYESQRLYWEEYNKTLSGLRERGVSEAVLMQYTGGSESDFMMLNWYSNLTDAQLAELADAQAELDRAEASAAQTISDLQLTTDASYQQMQEHAADLQARSDIHSTDVDRGGGRRYDVVREDVVEIDDDTSGEMSYLQEVTAALQAVVTTLETIKADVVEGARAGCEAGVGNITVTGSVSTGNVMLNSGAVVGALTPALNLRLGLLNRG